MAWHKLTLELGGVVPEPFETLLQELGAQALDLSDAGNQPLLEPAPGKTPIWRQVRLSALFPIDADKAGIDAALLRFAAGTSVISSWETLEDRRWEREWLRDWQALRCGERLWVCPQELEPPADAGDDAVVVRLDPGLAFGTGTHPTTRLCLHLLDALHLEGARVLDYGCGSGILAIAALRLDAATAVGVDIDPQALQASRSNARLNGVAERFELRTPEEFVIEPFDLVVANILAGTLAGLATKLLACVRPGGILALAGVLAGQADEVTAAFGERVAWQPAIRQQDWVLLTGSG